MRSRLLARGGQTWIAFAIYLAAGMALSGWAVVPHLDHACACLTARADPSSYMWDLAWWSHALLHGQDPLTSGAVFAPSQTPLDASGSQISGPAIALLPVTTAFGPIVAYNVLMLASPVLAALSAFALCRYLTERFAASIVGGYVFGFSAYMLGHLLGHANLVMVFPVPIDVLLTLRLIDGRIRRSRYVLFAGISLAFLLLSSTELAFTFVAFAAMTVLLAAAAAPQSRERIVRAIPAMVCAGLCAGAVCSPILFTALANNHPSGFAGNGDGFAGNVLGYLIPTRLFLGHGSFTRLAAQFTSGDIYESGLYVGAPLTFVVLSELLSRRRESGTQVMAIMLIVIGVLTLGSHLQLAGVSSVTLPWSYLTRSGFLNELVPARLALYTFLIVAILTARWLAAAPTGRRGATSWVTVALGLLVVAPDIGAGLWHSQTATPRFFSSGQYRHELHRGENVLMLPDGTSTDSMLWQAETGMWFRQATGYLGRFTPPAGEANTAFARRTPIGTIEEPGADVVGLRSFLRQRGIGAIILDPNDAQGWRSTLASLHLRGQSIGGVVVYPVPRAHPQNAMSSRATPTGSS